MSVYSTGENMIVFYDTETTGLLKPAANDIKQQPHIIEICVMKFDDDMNHLETFESFVKPPMAISDEITKITKITNEDLKDAPNFASIYPALCDIFLGSRRMVAHNLGFDRSMLANELVRIDRLIRFPWAIEHVCTVERSMSYEGRRLNLTKLHKLATGKETIEGAHRAKTDVLALVEGYKFLLREGKIK